MVPWHMQLKYLNNEEQLPVKKKKKWRKKYVKKRLDEQCNDDSHTPSVTMDTQDDDYDNHTPSVTMDDDSHTPSITASDTIINGSHTSSIEDYNCNSLSEIRHDNAGHTHSTNEHCDVSSLSINERCITDHAPSPDTTSETELKGFKTYYRYYHVFCDGELTRLCDSVNNVIIIDSWYDHENWCILLEKRTTITTGYT